MQSVWRRIVVCLIPAVSVSLSAGLHAQGLLEESTLSLAARAAPVAAPVATAATAFTVDLTSFNPGANIERSACVTVAIRANLAYECGDVRLTYALPATRFRNQTRAPVMLYNSQFARPTPIVRVLVAPTASWPNSPQSVAATLFVQRTPGGSFDSVKASTWNAADLTTSLGAELPSQLALSFDATSLATNLYAIEVEVSMNFGGGSTVQRATASGELAIVNRKGSEFGTGWWVAGYERLQRLSTGDLYWIGGDGSTRRYALLSATPAIRRYAAATLTGRDSLTEFLADSTFRRHLPRGAYVHFKGSPNGTFARHDQTVSTHGAVTRFDSQRCTFLTDIVVTPSLAQTSVERRWRFWYDGYDSDDPCALYNPASPSA